MGALGEGRIDAVWGLLGMLAGATIFIEAYPFLSRTVLASGRYGSITLSQVFGVSDWLVIIVFVAAGIGMFALIEKKGL
ncbi:MAG: hypothetical protein AB1499_15875 [Nitrospirota bacterium]